jgi:precorrin-6x reductase
MATLRQAAALTAYQLRSSSDMGRRKVTAQMVRDLAEPYAVAFVTEHLDEYEDVPVTVKAYVDAVVDAFRMDHGVLSQVEYDAHVQAVKDAGEEAERTKRLCFHTVGSESDLLVHFHAQRRAGEYVFARYVPAGGKLSDEDMKLLVESLLKKPEVVGDMQEYTKQYVISYKEWMAEHDFAQMADTRAEPAETPSDSEPKPQKKRRWLF